jgi:hypothetical protein
MNREYRVSVSLSDHENALVRALVAGQGAGDAADVLRFGGVQHARETLARTAPERLAEIDRRHGEKV